MKIIITTQKPVLTQFGRLPYGMATDVPDQLAKFLVDRGDAAFVETKEAAVEPEVEQLSKTKGRRKEAK